MGFVRDSPLLSVNTHTLEFTLMFRVPPDYRLGQNVKGKKGGTHY